MAPLFAIAVSETLAMATVIAIGVCLFSNEILKRTKGHELGLGFVSIGFGMAFFIAIQAFGGVSACCNPAVWLVCAGAMCD